jgi:PST family polysaccharide transporter
MDEKAVRGIPWTILTYGATKVATVLTTVALARLLAPSDFGLFALATIGVSLLSIFNGNWLGATLIVRTDMDERSKGTVLTLVMLSGALLAVVLAASAPLAAAALDEPRLEGMLMVFAAILLFSGINWFYEMVMQRELAFRKRFVAQVSRAATFSVVSISLAVQGAGVWSLVIAHVAGHLANGVVLFSLAPYRVRPAFDRRRAREIVHGSRGFLGQELAQFCEQNFHYVAIGRMLGASQLGFYSLAYRQAELPYFAIADPVATVTFPAFAQMRARGLHVGHSFLTALRLVVLVTCPVGILLSAAPEAFTEAIFGPKWLPMASPLAVLGIWAIARPLQATIGRLLNSLGAAWLYGRISVIGLAPFAIATVAAAHFGGITAVAWVLLAYMVILTALLMRVVAHHADVPIRLQWQALRPLAVACVASWLATRATADALEAAAPFVCLAASGAVCVAVYAIAVRLGDPEVFRMALRQLRRALGGRAPAVAPQ